MQVQAAAFEVRVGTDVDQEDQIAGWASERTWGAMASDPNFVPFASACRDPNDHLFAPILNAELELGAADRARQVDRHFAEHVASLGGATAPAAPAPGEEVAEQIAEAVFTPENFFEIHVAGASPAHATAPSGASVRARRI